MSSNPTKEDIVEFFFETDPKNGKCVCSKCKKAINFPNYNVPFKHLKECMSTNGNGLMNIYKEEINNRNKKAQKTNKKKKKNVEVDNFFKRDNIIYKWVKTENSPIAVGEYVRTEDRWCKFGEMKYKRDEEGNFFIKKGTTFIPDKAFDGRGEIKSIQLPDSLRSIGNGAFQGCGQLKTIQIPQGVTFIGESAFAKCTGLAEIILLGTLREDSGSIGNGAFQECSKLRTIQIPEGVTSIGKKAFADCKRLEGIILPETLHRIGEGVFLRCKLLKNIRIPPGIKTIPKSAFHSCEKLIMVTFPKTIEIIEEWAFYDCGLIEIDLRESIQKIGCGAFDETYLKTVRFPKRPTDDDDYDAYAKRLYVLFSAFSPDYYHDETEFVIGFTKTMYDPSSYVEPESELLRTRNRSAAVSLSDARLMSLGDIKKQRNKTEKIYWA